VTKKNNELEERKSGDEPIMSKASGNHIIDMFSLDVNMTRRQILEQATFAGLLFAFPWGESAFAAEQFPSKLSIMERKTKSVPPPPQISFMKNKTDDGIIGPFGEVRIYNLHGQVVPFKVTALNGMAEMNFSGRTHFVRFGSEKNTTAITLTTSGVRFGASVKPVPWSAAVVRKMIKDIAADPDKKRGAMLLRSALHTSFPVAKMQLQPKLAIGKKMAAVMSRGTAGFSARSMDSSIMNCVVTEVPGTVVNYISELVAVIKTAAEQFDECVAAKMTQRPCSLAGDGAWLCAWGLCSLETFLDIITGWIEVTREVVTEVVREVVVCTAPLVNNWPNPWDIPHLITSGAIPENKRPPFTQKDIDTAISLLKKLLGVGRPFIDCLVNGRWSIAQLNTQLKLGGPIVIPYGVKVCITSECARKLESHNIGAELTGSWILLLTILGALSPAFLALAAGFIPGIPPVVATTIAAVAATNPTAIAVAGIILAFIMLALWYATAISAQLHDEVCCTDHLADGFVCIEHPTFAIGLVAIALLAVGGLNLVLIPPIVTG